MAKRSGALPFLPMLGALRSLIGEAANMAKAVNDSKAMRRHDRAMEQGRELYLAPQIHGLYLSLYKRGQGVTVKKKNVKETINAFGRNYKRANGHARETYARTVL